MLGKQYIFRRYRWGKDQPCLRIVLDHNAFSCHFFDCITGCRSNIISPLLCWNFVLWSPAKTQGSNERLHDKIRNSYRADSETEDEKDQGDFLSHFIFNPRSSKKECNGQISTYNSKGQTPQSIKFLASNPAQYSHSNNSLV